MICTCAQILFAVVHQKRRDFYGREEKYVQGFGGEILMKEIRKLHGRII